MSDEHDAVIHANVFLAEFILRAWWLYELETKWGIRPRATLK